MPPDPRELLPQDKCDIDRARAVISLGYPAVAPVLRELLEWLQDCNWPVSRPIGDFLATLPRPMAPLVHAVLRDTDDIWKYWCIDRLIRRMPPDVAERFRPELIRLARHPTPAERSEELDAISKDVLESLWPSRPDSSTACP